MQPARILVVGGAGYIGSHMVKALLEEGDAVTVLDDLSTGHRGLVPGARFVRGAVGDGALLDDLLQRGDFHAVMHFAARSIVSESVKDPALYWANNVGATLVLLQAMKRRKVLRFIFSSTAAVYGEPRIVPIPEDHPCNPTNPYGWTKLTVERMIADYARGWGLQPAIFRYFNAAGADPSATIGERHVPETHLIPIVLQCALGQRSEVSVYGTDYPTADGTCVRDYVHVCDIVSAHRLALERLLDGAAGGTYNLGNSRGHSVLEIVEHVRRIARKPVKILAAERRPGDPAMLIADSTLARRDLGWRPAYESLDEIVATAWRWHAREGAHRRAGSAAAGAGQ